MSRNLYVLIGQLSVEMVNNLKCMGVKQNENNIIHVEKLNLETGILYIDGVVYMLANERSKTVLIGYSTNMLTTLGRIAEAINSNSGEYGSMKEETGQLQLFILETNIIKADLKLRTSYWISVYRGLGYKFYKEINPIQYKIETVIESHVGVVQYYCYLVNKRKDRTLIGVFKKKKEMNEWIRVSYPDTSRIGKVVVHPSVNNIK